MHDGDPDPSTPPVPSAVELQRAIASVTGVATAEVTRADSGRDRLRISLDPGEDPEAVAWSVAATLRERFGIALDPAAITARVTSQVEEPARVIHTDVDEPRPPSARHEVTEVTGGTRTDPEAIAPTAAAPPRAPVPSEDLVAAARAALETTLPAPTRPAATPSSSGSGPSRRHRAAIRELTARADGDALDVTATLGVPGRDVTGRARGARTRRGRWRAIAEATIDALDRLAVGRVHGHVDHVTVLTFADLAHVSVSVTLLTERGEETFLGAALVRDDPDRAVMRAALDAVNRRIEPWLADGSTTQAS